MKLFIIVMTSLTIGTPVLASERGLDAVLEKLSPGATVCYEASDLEYYDNGRPTAKRIQAVIGRSPFTNQNTYLLRLVLDFQYETFETRHFKREISFTCEKNGTGQCLTGNLVPTFAIQNGNLILKNFTFPGSCSLKTEADRDLCRKALDHFETARIVSDLGRKDLFDLRPLPKCPTDLHPVPGPQL